MQLGLKQKSKLKRTIILLILGIGIGAMIGYVFQNSYSNELLESNQTYTAILENHEVNHMSLLRYTIGNNTKSLLIFWILCITILGIPYIIGSIVYQGFKIGFIICAMLLNYGGKGLVLYLACIFPQVIFYLPACLICLDKGYELATYCFHKKDNKLPLRKSTLLGYVSVIIIVFLVLTVGSVMEVYIGPNIIFKALKYCQ